MAAKLETGMREDTNTEAKYKLIKKSIHQAANEGLEYQEASPKPKAALDY